MDNCMEPLFRVTFDEKITEPGSYCYKVYAVYDDAVYSEPSNVVCLTYPLAQGVPIANWALMLGGLLYRRVCIFYDKEKIIK